MQVIQGGKIEWKKQALELTNTYCKACERTRKVYFENKSPESLLRLVYYWVKYLNMVCAIFKKAMDTAPTEELEELFHCMEVIKKSMKQLTPRQLVRVFPITKRYDGERYQSKDYFTTMEALTAHGLDTPIGDNLDEILWDYMDTHLMRFTLNYMGIVGKLHKMQTGRDWLFDFLEGQGTHLTTYSMATDSKTGKQYRINNDTGEVTRVRKLMPRYLNMLHGGSSK